VRWPWRSRRAVPTLAAAEDEQIDIVRGSRLPRETGSWRVTVMGPKGGSGKTPTAATLALLLGQHRGEITAVLDGNTHMGTLRLRLVGEDESAPEPLLDMADLAGLLRPEWPTLGRFCDLVDRIRVFSNTGVDPRRVEDMTGQQYAAFLQLLSRAAQLVISDMGTSTAGEVAVAALDAADQLVVCTEMRRDALELAVEWVAALAGQPVSYRPNPEDYSGVADGRYAELVGRAIVVVAPSGGDPAELRPLLDWLAQVTNQDAAGGRVVVVPHDPHVATGSRIRLDLLQPATRLAYLRVAAQTALNFALPPLAWGQPTATHPPVPPARAAKPTAATPVQIGQQTRPSRPAALMGQLELAGEWAPPPIRTTNLVNGSAASPRPSAPATPPVKSGPIASTAPTLPPQRRVATVASFALGRDLASVLAVTHTVGEVCTGCTDPDCSWPTIPGGDRS
jgi:MinD-like ATPase involved in chromosome partitioning or flagellar assembly